MNEQLPKHWFVKETAEEVAETAHDLILQAAKKTIKKNGTFKIVLASDITPENVYHLLAKEQCDWQHWHFYLGDERCLPEDHPERNSQMAFKTLLNEIDIPKGNIHFIPAERGAEKAARNYQAVIENALPFDMVLLGMGEDGHTASLFPEQQHPENELTHAVYNAPKPPPERVSLSRKALSQNHNLIIIVTGESKQESVEKWRNGEALPVSSITSSGAICILFDKKSVVG